MMQEVVERTVLPYSAVCYVFTTFPDGISLRGSGAIVGPNDVLTALHLVYQSTHGGWATQVSVTPGADTSPYDAPYGVVNGFGTMVGRAADWDLDGDGLITDAEAQGDLAVIGLRERIGDASGWLEPLQLASNLDAVAAGYPAHPPAGAGVGLMAQDAPAVASGGYGVYKVQGSLGVGGSGGPLIFIADGVRYIAGVLSSGTSDNSASTYAALFGAGTWAWLQQALAANDALVPPRQQSSIAGTPGADALVGDALDNSITAGQGNDTMTGASGNDTVDGGDGVDLAMYQGIRAAYTVAVDGDSMAVSDHQGARDGADQLVSVERLAFADGRLAFDLGGHAGVVARILGAVFGPQAAADPFYAGQGLARLDAGTSEADLVQLALDVRLGAHASDAAVVDLLYTNVTGASPSPEIASHFVAMLQSHEISQAGIAGYAALTDMNAANIGLAGLALAGLPYLAAG